MGNPAIHKWAGFATSLLISVCIFTDRSLAQETFQQLKPFLEDFCFDCHANGSAEDGLAIDKVDVQLRDERTFAIWERVYDRVRSGEMPPRDESQPDAVSKENFLKRLEKSLFSAHAARKNTVLRRLNRREYENTLNDLFGTHLDLQSLLPEDGRSHEFDNVGASLNISMVHLQQYLNAIDSVIDSSVAKTVERPKPTTRTVNYADTREGKRFVGSIWKKLDDGSVVFFHGGGYPTGMLRDANARQAGWYRIRISGYAYQSSAPVTFAVGAMSFQSGSPRPVFGYFSFLPGGEQKLDLIVWLEKNYMLEITPWGLAGTGSQIQKTGLNKYSGPGLAIRQVGMIGPLIGEFPSRGHRLIFDGVNRNEIEPRNPNEKKRAWYVPRFEIRSEDPRKDAEQILLRVARRAFRRPVESDEIQRYIKLFQDQKDSGETFESAIRTSVAAIFCSPDFLYLNETYSHHRSERDGDTNSHWLNDDALASRLSYFLTRTAPDAELMKSAASGKLSTDPQELLQQTRRLLKFSHRLPSPRATDLELRPPLDQRWGRFVIDFTDAWLNLRDIEFTSPDKNLYPEFDDYLQYSMLAETREFFSTLIRDNAPIRNLVQSDFAMLNERLAIHYGIPGVQGPQIRRIRLGQNSVRGGLLAQASVLKVSANGTNTSPVVRGVWVTERLLGRHAPPPPSGVSGVEPDVRGAATLRELLAKHRSSDNCRNCHAQIDPPGFALESFNPIGGWRNRYRSLGEGEPVKLEIQGRKVRYRRGPPVDASGKLPDGREFNGFIEFQKMLASDQETLARALTTKLLTFATGREMGFSDRAMIERVVRESAAKEYGIASLIEAVVLSEAFRRK